MYALTTSMADIMMMSRAKRRKDAQVSGKTKTQTKPALSNRLKFDVVTVTADYLGTKDRQRRNGTSPS